jgi:hypothetical protein
MVELFATLSIIAIGLVELAILIGVVIMETL